MNSLLTTEQQKDIGEMASILIVLSKIDRELLMSNARTLETRQNLVFAEQVTKAH